VLVAKQPPADTTRDTASAMVHNQRGRDLLNQGKSREAIEELNEAIRQSPDFALAYNARGFGYYLLRDYPHAMADLDHAIQLNPKYLNAYHNRSVARKAAGDATGSQADAAKERELSTAR
jgi:tetratricopeptide (TPR) repeat protein